MSANSLIKREKKPRHKKTAVGDLYAILGVERNATNEEIRAAFRDLMRVHHPDVNGGVQSAEFNQIKDAYDVLIDHQARCIYDATGQHPHDKKAQVMAAAIDGLRQCFNMILEQVDPDMLERCDLMGSIKKFIDAKTQEEVNILAHLKETEKNLRRHKRIIEKRLKCKVDGGNSVFLGVIQTRLSDIVNKQIPIVGAIEVKKEMLRLLQAYDFDFIKENAPIVRHISPSTTTTFAFRF